MDDELLNKKCVPCEGGVPPFTKDQTTHYLFKVKDWQTDLAGSRIAKKWRFDTFLQAVEFVNKVAAVAEGEGHHPTITIDYNEVRLESWTHTIGGLSENDFILAAKIDALIPEKKVVQ